MARGPEGASAVDGTRPAWECTGCGAAGSTGLPAQASQASSGSSVSQPGNCCRRLAARRIRARRGAPARLSGRALSRLPASISFSSCGRWPSAAGRWLRALSVRVSQRRAGGRASAGTSFKPQARKPTWLSAGQSPSTGGRCWKRLPEQNSTFSRRRRPKSSGSVVSAWPLRSSTSRLSARPSTSRGSSVRRPSGPLPRRSRVAPARSPRRRACRLSSAIGSVRVNRPAAAAPARVGGTGARPSGSPPAGG